MLGRALALALLAALPASAAAAAPPASWPPADGPGALYAHYGEEHWNDADGGTLLPKVVADVARFKPVFVTMSGDKGNNGTAHELEGWRKIMGAYDSAGVPYFAGVGNHDGTQATPEAVTDEAGGSTPVRDISEYARTFADRPYPFGDAAPYADARIGPRERPADDPAGASTHYFVDGPGVRWIFLDNSCYGIINCDPLQSPPDGKGLSQYEYLEARAREADAAGRLVFVVMHMPTRDPRDQSYAAPHTVNHVMGKGISPDNADFEAAAARLGVDGVFLGHIKGQFQYVGQGGVPYYIDGGAGGELYTEGPIGTDHGYWHGYRLVRVDGGRVTTDAVPIFVPGSVRVSGPARLVRDQALTYSATGAQPVYVDSAKVQALKLRDPDPTPPESAGGGVPWLPLGAGAVAALVLAGVRWGRQGVLTVVVAGFAGAPLAALAAEDPDGPTRTPKSALPDPARIWTTSDPQVLAPLGSNTEDARRDPARQTQDGRFEGRCPGTATISVTSGWETASMRTTVPSADGPVARSVRRGARTARPRRSVRVARIALAQPARVEVRVERGGRLVRTPVDACRRTGVTVARFTPPRRGTYRIAVRVRSDRPTVVRRYTLRVR